MSAARRSRPVRPLLVLLVLAAPLAHAAALGVVDERGDERLTAQYVVRHDPLAPLPGACHAPAVDIHSLALREDPDALVVSLVVEDATSRAFSCPALAPDVRAPRYAVDFFPAYRPVLSGGPVLMLGSSEGVSRCWAWYAPMYFPTPCDLEMSAAGPTWRIPRATADALPLATTDVVARAAVQVGELELDDHVALLR